MPHGKGSTQPGWVLHIFEELSKCLQIEREKIRKAVHGTEKKCAEHRGNIWELGGKSKIRRRALIKISKKKVSLTLQ